MTTQRDDVPQPGKVYSLSAIAEGKSLAQAEVTLANPHPSDAEKAGREAREVTQPPAQLPLAREFDDQGAAMRRDSKRADAVRDAMPQIDNAALERYARWQQGDGAVRLEVGGFYCWSWGYDQTNIDFYEVVGHKGKTMLILRAVASRIVDGAGSPSEKVVAVAGEYSGDPFPKRPSTTGAVRFGDWRGAYGFPWGGTPRSQTGAMWGH